MNRWERAGIVREPSVCAAYRAERPWCEVCGVPARNAPPPEGLQVHHLCQGAGRSDERCCILVLCGACHRLAHGARIVVADVALPKLTKGAVLTAKWLHDAGNWDAVRLEQLRREALPPLEPLPEYFAAQWDYFQGGRR